MQRNGFEELRNRVELNQIYFKGNYATGAATREMSKLEGVTVYWVQMRGLQIRPPRN